MFADFTTRRASTQRDAISAALATHSVDRYVEFIGGSACDAAGRRVYEALDVNFIVGAR
jgi:hypothetical protein